MSSETHEHARGTRQRVHMTLLVPLLGLSAAVLVWMYMSTQHTFTSGPGSVLEVSQMEVEKFCNMELANIMPIQNELRRLAERFDNLHDILGSSTNPAAPTAPTTPSIPANTTPRHLRHLLDARLPAQLPSGSPGACPARLSSALTTMSSWLGGLHSEVLALKRAAAAADAKAAAPAPKAEGLDFALKQLETTLAGKAAADQALLAANKDLTDSHQQVQQLQQQLATANKDLAECRQHTQQLQQAVDAANKELPDTQQQTQQLQQQLDTATKDAQDCKEQAQQLQQKLAVAQQAAAAAGASQPNGQCWIRDKSDGVLVNRTVLRGSPVYVDNVRQSMVLPLNDEWVSKWIADTESPFDTPILHKMLGYIRDGDVVLDIGANLGTYAIWFAQRVGAAGSVWAFEPQPYVYQVLCSNVVINGHRNIRTVNGALSFRPGMASMDSKVPDGTSKDQEFHQVTTNHTTKVNYGGRRLGMGGEKVPMLMLDSLRLPKVSFMKIDVQGAEPLVIWGARETIKRTLPVINYEASAGYKVTDDMKQALKIPDEVASFDIAAWLKSIGYKYMELIQEDQFWVPPGWVPPPGWVAPANSNAAPGQA